MREPQIPSGGAAVDHAGHRLCLSAGEVYTFGRGASCTACVDSDDLGISRVAGSVEHEAGTWWVLNRSTVRPLTIVDDLGIRSVLAPGRRVAVDGALTVVVEGSIRRHAFEVVAEAPGAFGAPVEDPPDAPRHRRRCSG